MGLRRSQGRPRDCLERSVRGWESSALGLRRSQGRPRDCLERSVTVAGSSAVGLRRSQGRPRHCLERTVSQHGSALEWASEDLKGDREIVLKAVSKDGSALQWASEDVKGDRKVVLKAVSQNWHALFWASSEFCEDQEVQELISGTDFEHNGLLLKVSLLSGRSCTLLWTRLGDFFSLLERCSAQLGLECQQVIDNGKLVHQCEAKGIIGSWTDLQPGKMHFVTLALFLAACYRVICSLISAVH